MSFQTEIVTNSKREVLTEDWGTLIYIPLSEEEQKLLAPDNITPCWRISLQPKENTQEEDRKIAELLRRYAHSERMTVSHAAELMGKLVGKLERMRDEG